MTTFLDHPACWRRATLFYQADALPDLAQAHPSAACARRGGRGQSPGTGRGHQHLLPPHRGAGDALRRGTGPPGRAGLFFCLPRGLLTAAVSNGWTTSFGRRPHHPAFEVVYVYSQPDGTLDVNVRGARTAVEPLQGLFAAAILKQPTLPPDPTDDRVYDLNPLRDPEFEFVYDSGSGIQEVVGDEAAPRLAGDDGGPPHARSRCGQPPDGGLRPARAIGIRRCPFHLYRRHSGRVGGVGDHGERPAAEARDDVASRIPTRAPCPTTTSASPCAPCCTPPGSSQRPPPTRRPRRDDAAGGPARPRGAGRGARRRGRAM